VGCHLLLIMDVMPVMAYIYRSSCPGKGNIFLTGRPKSRGFIPGRGKRLFSPLYVVQTGSGANPTSYPMVTWGSFPGVKRPGREADHLPPTSAEVNNTWIYTSTPPYIFVGQCFN
jgi:hypothetical protein